MPEGITGQVLHQLLKNPQWTADSWNALLPVSQKAYNTIAEKLNAAYLTPLQGELERQINNAREAYDEVTKLQQRIAPLQGLVMQWRQLLQEHDELSVMSLTEIEDWHKHWELLKQRSTELLGEEQKVEG